MNKILPTDIFTYICILLQNFSTQEVVTNMNTSTPVMAYCQNSEQNIIRINTTKHASCNKWLVFIPLCISGTYQHHKI